MSQSIPSSSSNKKHTPLPPPPPLDENGENLPDRLARSSRFPRNTKDDDSKSPLSPESERSRTLGSPAVGSLDDSPSSGTKELGDHQNNQSSSDAIRPYRAVKTTLQEPDQQQQLNKRPLDAPGSLQAAQLVSELADSLKTKSAANNPPTPKASSQNEDKSHEIDFRANLRKVSNSNANSKQEETSTSNPHEIDFKASLRKRSAEEPSSKKDDDNSQQDDSGGIVDFKARLRKPRSPEKTPTVQEQQSNAEEGTVDFKARLRKVSGNKPVVTVGVTSNKKKSEDVEKVKEDNEEAAAAAPANGVPATGEEKRKSTGSISSLRKMWESTDGKDMFTICDNKSFKTDVLFR